MPGECEKTHPKVVNVIVDMTKFLLTWRNVNNDISKDSMLVL